MKMVGLAEDKAIFDQLVSINQLFGLNLELSWYELAKTNQKTLSNFAVEANIFISIIKGLPTLLYYSGDNNDKNQQNYELLKISPNWQSLTKRIVSAGRKSELLLQATKLTSAMRAIDMTAGFGQDSLILASTGAKVAMIEQNPLMFLLLQFEYQHMQQNPNWQKLLSRLTLHFGNATDIVPTLAQVDVVYLDPMFPPDSYSAKVNKNMQVLHQLAEPPTHDEELILLNIAKNQCVDGGKVIVKRPKNAPFLANLPPQDSIANEAVRFDSYAN
ncbi:MULTISPECIES: class I SAM-dependent methyltransferase [unclassified Moraxella]|uniref:class I SAM-dependent methyltransferase n=1 Tax=unclassified Moraxella TaxID=2685852 RepID=UPI003AF6D81C